MSENGYNITPFTCEISVDNTNVISAKNIGDNSSCNTNYVGSYIGNPVHAATGNKYETSIDYTSPTFEFTHRYNSKLNKLDRQIGTQWRHSYYSARLALNPSATPPITFAERPDGRTVHFRFSGGLWVSDGDISDKLTEIPGNGWQLTTSDDTIEAYDTSGKLLSIIDRNDRTQTLTYDTYGRLSAVNDDTGRALNFTYDGFSRIQTMTDPAGGVYQYAYDTNGNLTSVIYPDTKTRTYHYNEPAYTSNTNLPNALTGITDENGVRYATYTYDTQGRAVVTEHAGGVERYALAYSANGNSTIVTDPLNSQYTHNFQTILGVAKSTGQSQPAGSGCSAASSAMTYDANGNVASRADFNGNKTCVAYDLNRNLEIARVEGLSSGNACPGDLIGYTPAANSAERKILTTWDVNFRLPVLIAEAKREISFVYDTHGNTTQFKIKDTATNATRTWNTSYSYYPSIPGVMLQKIENGPRTDVSDITTTDYYAPDAACTDGHFGCRGQIASSTNALGHITQITRYNAHGQPEVIIDPNGLTTTLAYDNRQRLYSRASGTEFTNNRLISQSDNTSFKLWSYDANSNRTQAQAGGSSHPPYTLDVASNRLLNVIAPIGKTYTYDAAGNPLSDGATTFTWNAAGTLASTVRNAKTHTYKTNALGERISKNGPLSSKFSFFYDSQGQLIGEYRDNSSTATPMDDWLVRQETIWLEDIPVAVIKKPTATSPIQVYTIHADHLNTPRVIVNASNIPVWRWGNVHAFGSNLPDEDPDGNSQLFEYHPRFPGQYFDKETNLHYNYFRYYEPETGRYISPDPIGLSGGLNIYGYALQNPLTYTDPTGEAVPALIAACAGNPACAAAVGAGVGALTGVLFDLGSQLLDNGGNLQCVDKGSVAISAITSAIPLGAAGSKALGRFVAKDKASLSTLHERGIKIPSGRKINTTLAGSNKVKNAQGDIFKRVDFSPSKPHGGLSPHTHPNFRNTLPDGSIRSGVSRHAQPVSRKDIIDAAREGAQRTGGF
ncbi:RHS repeat-associated core domain-containing protein [uncultured Nitrosomonas sp.]|uniref:RHS repeat-associated core domain-containing protein n=1 Tax=uncultured Nitrosomonas sp. TaxID=156424 RepID=UPI0025E06233|nr:RHS repeat-associated core domain-containing protein [uncultured Nitrosomonas sp.]